jgi:hypothetical protein
MKLKNLTQEEKEQLKAYIESIKEIKKEVRTLLEKTGYKLREDEGNMNRSSGLYMPLEQDR